MLFTGVSRARMTSRMSNHPLNDSTSNRASMPFCKESKLNLFGLALLFEQFERIALVSDR